MSKLHFSTFWWAVVKLTSLKDGAIAVGLLFFWGGEGFSPYLIYPYEVAKDSPPHFPV